MRFVIGVILLFWVMPVVTSVYCNNTVTLEVYNGTNITLIVDGEEAYFQEYPFITEIVNVTVSNDVAVECPDNISITYKDYSKCGEVSNNCTCSCPEITIPACPGCTCNLTCPENSKDCKFHINVTRFNESEKDMLESIGSNMIILIVVLGIIFLIFAPILYFRGRRDKMVRDVTPLKEWFEKTKDPNAENLARQKGWTDAEIVRAKDEQFLETTNKKEQKIIKVSKKLKIVLIVAGIIIIYYIIKNYA